MMLLVGKWLVANRKLVLWLALILVLVGVVGLAKAHLNGLHTEIEDLHKANNALTVDLALSKAHNAIIEEKLSTIIKDGDSIRKRNAATLTRYKKLLADNKRKYDDLQSWKPTTQGDECAATKELLSAYRSGTFSK